MTDIWGQRKKGLEEHDFHRKDRKLLEQMSQRFVTEERDSRQEASFSHCPKCREDLEEILFRGVTVDRCPGCFGVWLDAKEVERPPPGRAKAGSHFFGAVLDALYSEGGKIHETVPWPLCFCV